MAKPVGLNTRHASLRGSAYEPADGITRSHYRHGDEQGLLAPERFYQCLIIVAEVIDSGDIYTFRQLAGALRPGDSRNDKVAFLEQCIGDVFALLPASLSSGQRYTLDSNTWALKPCRTPIMATFSMRLEKP